MLPASLPFWIIAASALLVRCNALLEWEIEIVSSTELSIVSTK